jgi:hypothetical protein
MQLDNASTSAKLNHSIGNYSKATKRYPHQDFLTQTGGYYTTSLAGKRTIHILQKHNVTADDNLQNPQW